MLRGKFIKQIDNPFSKFLLVLKYYLLGETFKISYQKHVFNITILESVRYASRLFDMAQFRNVSTNFFLISNIEYLPSWLSATYRN